MQKLLSTKCKSFNIAWNYFVLLPDKKVNAKKTSICFSKNVSISEAKHIAEKGGYAVSEYLGRYLGAQVYSGRTNASRYHFITKRVQARLGGWKKQCLSLAGRMTLAQSVLGSMVSFHMQHEKIPKDTILSIEKAQRGFIWDSDASNRKAHLISWETMCKNRHEEGLEF